MQRVNAQLFANQIVKVSDSADSCSFVIPDVNNEEFFRAQNDLYSVKSHGSRLTRKGNRGEPMDQRHDGLIGKTVRQTDPVP